MSLIITSSHKQGETNQLQVDAPYNYRNNFSSGMTIPPNAQIAVESVKLNRNPMIDYESGQVTNFWFGERLTENASFENSLSYIIPSINTIDRNLGPEDFKENFEAIIKDSYSLHPEIDTVGGILMTPLHTTATVVNPFQGYRYEIDQVSVSATSIIPPDDTAWTIKGELASYTSGVATASGTDAYVQFQPEDDEGGPISLFDGQVVFNNFLGDQYTCGLSRPILDTGDDYLVGNPQIPAYSFRGIGRNNDQFYDYAAQVGEDDTLRLFHAVPNPDLGGSLDMREIIYYEDTDSDTSASNGANSSFATGAPIPSASITDITFTIQNEKVIISCSGNVVAAPNITTSASFKDQVPKPVNQNCWKMYPTLGLWDDNDEAEITSYECRTSSTIQNNKIYNTWPFRCVIHADMNSVMSESYDSDEGIYVPTNPWNNADKWPESVDFRPLMKRLQDKDLEQNPPFTSDYIRPYKGLNASIAMDDYEPIFIVGKSERYTNTKIQEWQANSKNALGFSPFSVVPLQDSVDATTGSASFSSTTRPNLSSEHSTFIRVPTLNHKTFNFGTGNPSKILFQVPRFDNAGAETGALYFQNNDKSFVDLNNPTELRITDLDVQFVRKDEKFAKDLTGSSEVVFFVRQKPRM